MFPFFNLFSFKIMKRIVFAGVAAFFGLLVSQTSFAQVQVGFRAGANIGFASKPDFMGSALPTLHSTIGPTGA